MSTTSESGHADGGESVADGKVAEVMRTVHARAASEGVDVDLDAQLVHFFLHEAGGDVERATRLVAQQLGLPDAPARDSGGFDDPAAPGGSGLRRRRPKSEVGDGGSAGAEGAPLAPHSNAESDGAAARERTHVVAAVVVLCWRTAARLVRACGGGVCAVAALALRSTRLVLRLVVPARAGAFLHRLLLAALAILPGGPPASEDGRGRRLPPSASHAEAARRFAAAFARDYGPPEAPASDPGSCSPATSPALPPWEECGHWEALSRARQRCTFLVVYLHAPWHRQAQRMCRETLTNAEVASSLQEGWTLWGGSVVDNAEALRLSRALRVSRYPALAVLCHAAVLRSAGLPTDQGPFGGRDAGHDDNASTIAMLACSEGFSSASDVLQVLAKVSEDYGAVMVAARAEQMQREADRRIRQEQEREFHEALEEDRRRASLREQQEQEALEALAREEAIRAELDAQAQKEQERKDAVVARRAQAQARVRSSPEPRKASRDAGGGEAGDGPVCAVRVRLPDGSSCTRRFLSSSLVRCVYDYVDSLDGNEYGAYKLVSHFPRRVLDASCMDKTLEEAGLAPQASLFLQSEED